MDQDWSHKISIRVTFNRLMLNTFSYIYHEFFVKEELKEVKK